MLDLRQDAVGLCLEIRFYFDVGGGGCKKVPPSWVEPPAPKTGKVLFSGGGLKCQSSAYGVVVWTVRLKAGGAAPGGGGPPGEGGTVESPAEEAMA